ncbi:MAG: hypothetical protein KAR05_01110 [Candidatus Omnitrophica bacterium]|nr:hypothetical protein [Candidatus Omnitrophota bacterium]
MAKKVAQALDVSPEKEQERRRRTQTDDGPRYSKMKGKKGKRFIVKEGDF